MGKAKEKAIASSKRKTSASVIGRTIAAVKGKTITSAKGRTIATVISMTVIAFGVLLLYSYLTNRTEPFPFSSKPLSESQKLIEKDLVEYYPETPREVTKLFAGMIKSLHNNIKQDEIKALGLKVREVYDTELLDHNPEDIYLTNLYTELADWKKNKRSITNYIVDEEQNQEYDKDGLKYSVQSITFTIQQNAKYTESWQVLLRLDNNNQWKILGWELVTLEDTKQ